MSVEEMIEIVLVWIMSLKPIERNRNAHFDSYRQPSDPP